jgi:hypothetical protein
MTSARRFLVWEKWVVTFPQAPDELLDVNAGRHGWLAASGSLPTAGNSATTPHFCRKGVRSLSRTYAQSGS